MTPKPKEAKQWTLLKSEGYRDSFYIEAGEECLGMIQDFKKPHREKIICAVNAHDRDQEIKRELLEALESVVEWAREQKIGIPVRCGHHEAIQNARRG